MASWLRGLTLRLEILLQLDNIRITDVLSSFNFRAISALLGYADRGCWVRPTPHPGGDTLWTVLGTASCARAVKPLPTKKYLCTRNDFAK